ncbi:MAG TPA: hypothetical protein VLN57_21170 [Xanthobacteraceae bacterium]|nr:hypothetical protein [Xanthobacteraceae bacterium]
MSIRTRGQGANIRIARNGVVLGGTMIKVRDFTATQRATINEDDYLGEDFTDLDTQHHGWDLGFTVDTIDAAATDYTDAQINDFLAHARPADVTITVVLTFADPTVRGKAWAYHSAQLIQNDDGFGGRKEPIKGKFSGKCQRRTPVSI